MLVSVIIPFFNTETKLLQRCLRSVKAQTHPDVEVIIVDDGSHPKAAREVASMVLADATTRVIHQANMGVASARNTGLDAARGGFACFLDSDDFIDPRFFSDALRMAISTGADVVMGGIQLVHESSSAHWRSGGPRSTNAVVIEGPDLLDVRSRVLGQSPSPHASTELTSATNVVGALYSNWLYAQVRFPDGVAHAEDRLFNVDAFALARRASFCSDIWYFYEQRSFGVTRTVGGPSALALTPTVHAFAKAGEFDAPKMGARRAHARPSATPFQISAAAGTFNYLKLVVVALAREPSRDQARSHLREVLASPAIRHALSTVPTSRPQDRWVVFLARRQLVRPVLAIARMRVFFHSVRAKSGVTSP